MTPWRWAWSEPAVASLQRMPWRDAARVDEAVQRFATTGEGECYRLEGDDAATLRLAVGGYRVRLSRDRAERVLRVWFVYRV